MEENNQQEYVIGIDLGTSSCKTIILGLSGKILGFGSAGYAASNMDLQWKEQDPDALFEGLVISLQSAISSPSVSSKKCLGISIGGALHSIMGVNHSYDPLTGILTWADTRATKQSEFIAEYSNVHDNYLKSGCPNNSMYPFAKILWMREKNINQFKEIDKFISAKEYILWKLTGERVTDYAIASGSGLFNINRLQWDTELLEIVGINENKLALVQSPLYRVGELSGPISHEVGLRYHIPVFLGSADAVNSSLGAGTINSDSITCMVGSSGALRTISDHPILDSKERLWCYCINHSHWLVGGAINNGGLALEWLRGIFNNINNEGIDLGFDQIIKWASKVPPLAEGLFCLPFFTSERSPYWNPKMRAILWGMNLNHDHRHISQAILEGIGFRLKSVLDALIEEVGIPKNIRASGGFTKSDHWVSIVSNIFNMSIQIPKNGETSALGAAYWALLGLGIYNNFNSLCELNPIERIIKPQKDYAALYQSAYPTYLRIYMQNREIFNSIN